MVKDVRKWQNYKLAKITTNVLIKTMFLDLFVFS